MKATTIALALAVLATGCWNPFALLSDPTLEIQAYDGEYLVASSRDDTSRVLIRQRFDDPKGFAGLEIVVDGAGPNRRTYTASSLADGAPPQFRVPASGYITVTARIVQEGRIVAEVSIQWLLKPEIQWTVEVDRARSPLTNGFTELEKPACRWFGCQAVLGDAIAEDAANYEGEALWMTVFAYHPGECADVC